MRKILWIIQRPYTPQTGGASRRIQELAQVMQDGYGWDVQVLSTPSRLFLKSIIHKDVKVKVIKPIFGISNYYSFLLSVLWLIFSHLRSYQVLHINAPYIHDGLLVRILNVFGVPTNLQLTLEGRDDPFTLEKSQNYPKFIIRFLMRGLSKADNILCMSPKLCSLCKIYGCEDQKIRWSPHAKDPSLFRPPINDVEVSQIRKEFGLPLDKILIGFLGFLSKRKGFPELIEVWKNGVNIEDAWLSVAGPISKGQENYISQFLHSLPLSVSYLGVLSRHEVAKYLRCLDLFILPSRREGFSGALVEALLSGTPCLTTNLHGVNDTIINDGINGILVSPNNTAELKSKLNEYLSDSDFRNSLVVDRGSILRIFSYQLIYSAYDRLYRKKSNDLFPMAQY